ncbi:MAG: oligosaccharide flippase family protein [Sulfurimonadaceae bacterium]
MKKIAEDKKRLLSNFFSLSLIKISSMILPLVTLPYLVSVLGIENFGLISFVLSIIMYFDIFVSFGFELSATRQISVNRDNIEKVSEIFSSVMVIKFLFLMISFLLLSLIILLFDNIRTHAALYYVTFGVVVGNALFPIWFFQGIERMKYITYFTLSTKVFFTLFVFIVVHEQNDYIYVPLLTSIGAIVGGVISIWVVLKYFSVQFFWPSKEVVNSYIIDSYQFFLSRVANQGGEYYAITMIGIYFGNTVVGYYSMIDKLLMAFTSLGGLVAQTIYPYMTKTQNVSMFKKIFILVVSMSIVILFPVMFFRDMIIELVFRLQDALLSDMFLIMFSGSIFGIINALIGYPLLAALGYVQHANNSLIIASVFNVAYITLVVVVMKSIYLAAFSIIVFNLFSVLLRSYYINKTKILR